ncbi:MAG: tRNA pseudouridine(55) synthase TruB [Bdellovibrionaceae bacterium]|nr:tRNA pseudouridine(55) synthase TruB [Pseudobdellovibrionaceae bacterium]
MAEFHGLILVRKVSGMTSHDVVARLRRILNTKAVGHAGTLDPLAEGLMVALVGEATKLSQYILEGNKAYHLHARLGVETDTLDITGQTLKTSDILCDEAKIREAGLAITGAMSLPVPIFSAIKINGQKLYEYARNEQEVKIPNKDMTFWDVEFMSYKKPEAEFKFKCSKGSYVRSWIALLGQNLGCGATMSALTRTWSDPYYLDQSILLEDLEARLKAGEEISAMIPLAVALPAVKRVRIKGHDQTLLGNGQISHDLRSFLITMFDPLKDDIIQVVSLTSGKLLALVGIEKDRGFVIKRVIKY